MNITSARTVAELARRRIRMGATLVLAAAPCVVLAAPPSPAVYPDTSRIAPFFESAFTSRAALVGIGDSNQLYNTTGFEFGWHEALLARYGLWGTPLIAAGEEYGFAASSGTNATVQTAGPGNNGSFAFWGAPQPFTALMSSVAPIYPSGYLWVPASADMPVSATPHGLILGGSAGLDLNDALRFHFTHALFPNGRELHAWVTDGNWLGGVYGQATFSTLDPSPNANSAFEPAPAVTDTVDLPPAFRPFWLRLCFTDERLRSRGPFFLMYLQAENPNRQRGFAVHTFYGLGGASARDMAGTIAESTDAQLSLYFQRVRAPLGPNPKVIVRICAGVNDRSEWIPSYTNYILPANSPEAFRDNIGSIVSRIRGIWALNNWNAKSELQFLVTVTHAISNPDDTKLQEYRAALRTLADSTDDITLVDFSKLANAVEMSYRSWYLQPWDPIHLKPGGYVGLAERELEALVTRPCTDPADIDNNGTVDTRDLVALLSDFGGSWLTEGQGGDLDNDRDCDTIDLVNILSRFGDSTCNAQHGG
ncbi:MAG: SGNH/GDSL hydrolase family protein [Phycisphaerales bacterium]